MVEKVLLSPGGATEAKQDTLLASVGDEGATPPPMAGVGILGRLRAIYERLVAGIAVSGAVSVENWPVTQQVAGSVVVENPTPAPETGLAKETTLQDVRNRLPPTPLSQALTNEELRASQVDVADSGEREYLHVVATVTDSGDTPVHTPAAGKRVRLRWMYAVNNPSAESAPLIRVLLGDEEKYRAYAISKRQRVTGPIDGALVVNLSASGNVAVTALLEEIP
jgi:hypothetical protein